MKISSQLILSLIVILGVSGTANAKRTKRAKTSQKIYKVASCDCVGDHQGIPTFLSDLAGKTNVQAKSKSLKKAQAKANRKCKKRFKRYSKTKGNDVSIAGCRNMFTIAGTGRWQEL